MPLSPLVGPEVEHIVEINVREQGRDHASYNVAKLSLIPETSIPRARLRPRYGQGWLGGGASSRACQSANEKMGGLGHGGRQAQVDPEAEG